MPLYRRVASGGQAEVDLIAGTVHIAAQKQKIYRVRRNVPAPFILNGLLNMTCAAMLSNVFSDLPVSGSALLPVVSVGYVLSIIGATMLVRKLRNWLA